MPAEREIKLSLNPEISYIQRKLRASGFRVAKKRVFEANQLFDTEGDSLRNAGKLIRLRTVGDECILTYKGPNVPGRHKQREEIETNLGDADAFKAVLDRLGYRPTFRYEKYRTEYKKTNEPGVVTIDETPIGNFLEIEGAAKWIDETAKTLGFRTSDYITDSYGSLYLKHCAQRGKTPRNMVFGR